MKNNFKNNFIYVTCDQLLSLLLPLITAPYIARVILADGIGIYSYYYSIAYYFVIFIMLGLVNYGNRSIAKVRDNKKELSKTFLSIYAFQFVIGFIITIFYLVFTKTQFNSIYPYTLLPFVISAIFDVNWFFYGVEKFKLITIRSISLKIISILCIFIFVKSQSDLPIYCLLLSLASLISNLIVWPYLLKYITITPISFNDIILHIKPNLMLFIPVISISLYQYMDKIMLGFISNMEQVGLYDSSQRWLIIPLTIGTSFGTIMFPKMSNLIAKNINQEKVNKIIVSSLIFVMFLTIPITLGIMAIAKELIPWFLGNDFIPSITLVYLLLPCSLFVAFSNVLKTQYIIPHNMDKTYISIVFTSATINFILNLLLIPMLSSLGACISTLLTEFIVFILQFYFVNKQTKFIHNLKPILYLLSLGILMFIVVFYIPIINNNLLLTIIFKVIIGALIYLIPLSPVIKKMNKQSHLF
ncbi:oligosaccharide flippase family protein [Anaerorhabdus sp.]|uniref:oligosaccharide flippase family protein n=1 Tax=Anaerorhabdus sp. TaxID=1872524 RepID=UPI002FC6F1B6